MSEQQYDNTNSGVLFKNDKAGNDKRPDYKGNLDVNGMEFRISAWIKTKKDGSGKFMSLKVEPKEQQPPPQQTAHNQAKASAYQPQPNDDDSDSIPF
jgi:hypothetical protein